MGNEMGGTRREEKGSNMNNVIIDYIIMKWLCLEFTVPKVNCRQAV